MMRITSRKEMKKYLLERMRSAERGRSSDPLRSEAIILLCEDLLKSHFLKYIPRETLSDRERVHSECMSIYQQFLHDRFGVDAAVDQKEQRHLKSIIDYLYKHTDDTEGVILMWEIIHRSFKHYDRWMKDHWELKYIDSNKQRILTIIKSRYNGKERSRELLEQAVMEEFEYRKNSGRV